MQKRKRESSVIETGGNVVSVEGSDELEYVSESIGGSTPRKGFFSSIEDL